MQSNYVRSPSFSYPFSADAVETGNEWIAGEINEKHNLGPHLIERWSLFRSGQFVHYRACHTVQMLGSLHVLEILDVVTGAFEFATRMSTQKILSPKAAITFELYKVDGLKLTWPQDALGIEDAVGRECWCEDEVIRVNRQMASSELEGRRREYSLSVAFEIYSGFGWSNPPQERLADQQNQRFGAVR